MSVILKYLVSKWHHVPYSSPKRLDRGDLITSNVISVSQIKHFICLPKSFHFFFLRKKKGNTKYNFLFSSNSLNSTNSTLSHKRVISHTYLSILVGSWSNLNGESDNRPSRVLSERFVISIAASIGCIDLKLYLDVDTVMVLL